MGREIRKVALGWVHPVDSTGSFKPLYSGNLAALQVRWDLGLRSGPKV